MRTIFCENAPAPVGPYSQACVGCDLLFISGQIGTEPLTGEMTDSLDKQALQALENLRAILWTAGLGVEHLAMVNVYITDLDQFEHFNEVYAGFLGEHRPSRAVVEVSRLPKGAKVEISGIAVIPTK
ncbi:MAG: Rid family detoxifying hydrolase [Thermoplasmata archaeon]|nr:Rid family detoxifying hydrolase [Thermoplasmata archaeon]